MLKEMSDFFGFGPQQRPSGTLHIAGAEPPASPRTSACPCSGCAHCASTWPVLAVLLPCHNPKPNIQLIDLSKQDKFLATTHLLNKLKLIYELRSPSLLTLSFLLWCNKKPNSPKSTSWHVGFFKSYKQCLNSQQEGEKEGEEWLHDKLVRRNWEMWLDTQVAAGDTWFTDDRKEPT